MGVKRVDATEFMCDGCGAIQLVLDPDCYMGYEGSALWNHALGGNSSKWVACSKKCITKAIINVLEARD